MLAAALAVSLAGQCAVAAAGGSRQAEEEAEVDRGGGGVRAVDVLFDAAAGEDVAAAAPGAVGEAAGGFPDKCGGTPVIDWTRSGQKAERLRTIAGYPVVRSLRYSASARPSWTTTWEIPNSRARSVPGVGCKWMPPPSPVNAAVAERRDRPRSTRRNRARPAGAGRMVAWSRRRWSREGK